MCARLLTKSLPQSISRERAAMIVNNSSTALRRMSYHKDQSASMVIPCNEVHKRLTGRHWWQKTKMLYCHVYNKNRHSDAYCSTAEWVQQSSESRIVVLCLVNSEEMAVTMVWSPRTLLSFNTITYLFLSKSLLGNFVWQRYMWLIDHPKTSVSPLWSWRCVSNVP